MKKSKIKMTVTCEKCGKPAPIDEEHSNENVIAYDLKKSCECGGKFITKLEIIN